MTGTTPRGTAGEHEAARWVREMFGRVAFRYDLANHLLSFNIDRYWRRRTVARVRGVLENPEARVVDLCCGTGDLLLAFERAGRARLYGADFSHPMLLEACRKGAACLLEADALRLPLRHASVDLVSSAFGFRNLANYQAGLEEIRRVLRPGGTIAILEFSQPPNRLFDALYNWYSRHILPVIGGALSGTREAYEYLPASVRKFPSAEELADKMRAAGFGHVEFERMTGGIVALHLGTRE
jgi:demethylmenaquinone methyltransferase/2-methoxy-6-polyprenyl-1,4-benzoquinol methylase